jgi:hypothetical protein
MWQNWFHEKEIVWENSDQRKKECLAQLRKTYTTKNLEEVCQLDNNPLIQILSSFLNVLGSRFLATAVRNSKHKPTGGKWSFKEKVLVLSILKRGPKLSTFLQSLFPLPSRQTLQTILNTIYFKAVINGYVLSTLKHTMQTMIDGDRVCCIMFDEMSIRENLHFCEKFGCAEVIEDLRKHDRTIMPLFSWAVSCLLLTKCIHLLSNKYILFLFLIFWNKHKYFGDDTI